MSKRVPLPPSSCSIATPPELAKALATALGDVAGVKWLDPCIGEGALVAALSAIGVESKRIRAIDLQKSRGTHDGLARTIRPRDFITWSASTRERFERVICNPPFVPIASLSKSLQKPVLRERNHDWSRISLGSNYWVSFLNATMRLLRPEGSLGFILPAAYEYANYAKDLRDTLPTYFEEFEVHRCAEPLFTSVREGSVVVIGRGFKRPRRDSHRYQHAEAASMIAGLTNKNGSSTRESIARKTTSPPPIETRKLGEVIRVSIGAVTGDSGFFLLTEAERLQHQLPTSCLRPILTRARHLKGAILTKGVWRDLREKGERVWLFDPVPSTHQHSAVRKYLRLDAESGGCHRDAGKVTNRDPWYRVALPNRFDGLISGMSQLGPWIAFKSMSRLTASNTLYTVSFKVELSKNERAAWAISLMTKHGRESLLEFGRRYPDGLLKFEPCDVARVEVPVPKRISGGLKFYETLIDTHLTQGECESQAMADAWIRGR